jgi:RHS repeat-associated protein
MIVADLDRALSQAAAEVASVGQQIYIGQFADQSNLDYLQARYYDPSRGQFLSEDPMFWSQDQRLDDPQSLNSYSYAEDNPITNKDPDGKDGGLTIAALAGIVLALSAIVASLSALQTSGHSSSSLAPVLNGVGNILDSVGTVVRTGIVGVASTILISPGATIHMTPPIGGTAVTTPYEITANDPFSGTFGINLSDKGSDIGTTKPEGLPSGSKPIDKAGLPKGMTEQIKAELKSGSRDSTWVDTKTGDIYTNEAGRAIKSGNIEQYGKADGRGQGPKH